MIVCDNNVIVKPTQINNRINQQNQNAEAIEYALNQLIQHAIIYEEAKKKLMILR